MRVSFFTAGVSRKNGGSSSVVDLALAALSLRKLSAIYSPLGKIDFLYYRASGSLPLFLYSKHIEFGKYADVSFGGISRKSIIFNRVIAVTKRESIVRPNNIYIDDLGVSHQVASDIRQAGGVLILNHAGSPSAFIHHFGSAKYTATDARIQRYKNLLSRYDYCLFQSQSQIDEYLSVVAEMANFPKPMLIEPSCYEPDIREALVKQIRFTKDFTNIAIIGTIQPRKNQAALIDVCLELLKLNIIPKFHVVGGVADSSYYRDLIKSVKDSNLMQFFIFYGHRRNYLRIMAGCEIILQPSIEEGVSRILREALALGKPIVAYNISGSNGIVENGVTGFLVNLNDTVSMAYFCKQLIDCPLMYENISASCSNLFERRFSLQQLKTSLNEVISSVEKS